MAQLSALFTWRSAICESGLPPTARHVALTLSLHMNERGGSAFPGATLLATDGAGINMIARSASRRVQGMNLFPGSNVGSNAEFFELVANIVSRSSGAVPSASNPIPTLSEWSLILMALSVVGIAACTPRLRSTRGTERLTPA